MKKLFLLSVSLVFLLTISKADTITNIQVTGNDRISKETIILFSGISKEDKLDEIKLNNIIKELYSTEFFENVSVSFKDQILLIEVKENPIIQSVKFEGIKKTTIIEVLQENIQLKEKNSFLKSRVKKDEELITNILKSNGYYFAEVTTTFKKQSNNAIDLIFNVNLGKKAFIKRIKFIGDKKFKDRKLRSVIVSEESRFWKFISNKKFLDIKRISLDKKLLINYYKNRGYYNVSVESSSARIINESDFEIIFNINAGKKYQFGSLNLNLPQDFNNKNFEKLSSLLNKLEGKVYSLNKINDILDEIDDIVLIQEFQFANVKYKENIDNNNININFSIEEGEKIYLGRIDIFGNYITEEKVIRNALIIDEGDAFNDILWNKSINEVKSRNIFSKVNYKILNTSDKSKKNIQIFVDEKPTGEISAGAGTGTSGSSISAGLKEGNYLGKGVKVNSGITLSDDSITGIISINNPNYKNSDRSLRTSFESSERDQMSRYGYKNTQTGFSIGTTYEQFDDVYFSPSVSTYFESLETSSKASSSKKKQEGDYFETEFKYGLTLNRLNQNFQPSEGFKTSFYQTIPLYTDDNTLENTFRISRYYSLKDEMIFSLKFYTKAVNSLTGDDVRVTKRVFIPSKQLRGFEIGKVGPQDGGDYIGGNYGASLNFAATLPKLLPEFEDIDFSLFLDVANVWGVDYNDSLDDNKVRSSTGLALDWFTPIGPLSLSIAQPITKSSNDKTEKIRFNIGTTF